MVVSLVDLLDPGQYYPVYQLLLSLLDSLSIIRLSKTCRRLATLYRGAIRQEWSVDRLLGRFVEQPVGLRSEMRRHQAVIPGELALQFFSRVVWPDSSLDLVVEKPSLALALGSYLVAREGYNVVPKEEEPSPRYLDGTVWNYVRDERVVQIVCSNLYFDGPVQSILKGFYGRVTTAVVNFITADRAYCLFPRATFVRRGVGTLRGPCYDREYLSARVEYEQRFRLNWKEEPELRSARRVGDAMSWVIPFDILPLGSADSEVESVRFEVTQVGTVDLTRE